MTIDSKHVQKTGDNAFAAFASDLGLGPDPDRWPERIKAGLGDRKVAFEPVETDESSTTYRAEVVLRVFNGVV